MNEVKIIPTTIKFKKGDVYNFDSFLSFFQWNVSNTSLHIDFSKCKAANYQALSLYILYIMYMERNQNSIQLNFAEKQVNPDINIKLMWENMGGDNWLDVLNHSTIKFRFQKGKSILPIRKYEDIKKALGRLDKFFQDVNLEYEKSLTYILTELLYNTIEHSNSVANLPSLFQYNYYTNKNEVSFIIADCGIGIKKHLSTAYPGLSSDIEAIMLALKPQVSGTFFDSNPYKKKNNAGVGLYISSSIVKKLYADMYIISGNGLVHVSPTEITNTCLDNYWQGTFILVSVRLGKGTIFNLDQVMSSLREQAEKEALVKEDTDLKPHYLHIVNYFGKLAENKGEAISYRDKHLLTAISEGKDIVLDFDGVVNAPHSFLNALLSSVIQELGMKAYKKIKVKNAPSNIRETIDFILDDHTR